MGHLNIRRAFLRDKLLIREVTWRTGRSLKTVIKHLDSGTIGPKFATPGRPSKLDPYAEKFAVWLKIDAAINVLWVHPQIFRFRGNILAINSGPV